MTLPPKLKKLVEDDCLAIYAAHDDNFMAGAEHLYSILGPEIEKIIKTAEECLWIDQCRCDEAWTGRGRHEPNTYCGELDPIRESLQSWREFKGE